VFCYEDLGFYMYVILFSSSLNGVLHILRHIVKVSLDWKGSLAVKAWDKNCRNNILFSQVFRRVSSNSGWGKSRAVPSLLFFVEIFGVTGLLIVEELTSQYNVL